MQEESDIFPHALWRMIEWARDCHSTFHIAWLIRTKYFRAIIEAILALIIQAPSPKFSKAIACPDPRHEQSKQEKWSDPRLLKMIPEKYFYVMEYFNHCGKQFG